MRAEKLGIKLSEADPFFDELAITDGGKALAFTLTLGAAEKGIVINLVGFINIVSKGYARIVSDCKTLALPSFLLCDGDAVFDLGAPQCVDMLNIRYIQSELSMARLKSAISRKFLRCESRVRMVRTCSGRRGGFCPIILPLFHARFLVDFLETFVVIKVQFFTITYWLYY